MNQNVKTYQLTIKGIVQNVGFRYWFNQEAINLNLKGYVKNSNKSNEVKSTVQGKLENILLMIEKCKSGPKLSLVEEVIAKKTINDEIYTSFTIK